MEDLKILTKMEELGAYTHQVLFQFPKYEKFVLCARIRSVVDDSVIISNDKEQLWDILGKIDFFVQTKLQLKLNPKTTIFPISQGIDFCGYRVWFSHILPRKRTIKRARKSLGLLAKLCSAGKIPISRYREGIMSFLGYAKHCNSSTSVNHILQESFVRRSYQCK